MQAKACPLPGPPPATRSVYGFAARRVRVRNGPGKPELAAEAGRGSRAQKPPPAASQWGGGEKEGGSQGEKMSLHTPQLLFLGKGTLSPIVPALLEHPVPSTLARE